MKSFYKIITTAGDIYFRAETLFSRKCHAVKYAINNNIVSDLDNVIDIVNVTENEYKIYGG